MRPAAPLLFLTAVLLASPAPAAEVTVEVTNATQGITFTPSTQLRFVSLTATQETA